LKKSYTNAFLTACSVTVLLSACGSESTSNVVNTNAEEPALAAATEQNTNVSLSTTELAVPQQFDWSNNNTVALELSLMDAQGEIAAGTGVTVYAMPDSFEAADNEVPSDADLLLATKLYTGVSDSNGRVKTELQAPGHAISAASVYVKTNLLGIANSAMVPITVSNNGNRIATWEFGPQSSENTNDEVDPNNLDGGLVQDDGSNVLFNDQASLDYYLKPFNRYYHWYYGHMPATRRQACDVVDANGPTLCTSAVSREQLNKLTEIIAEGQTPPQKYMQADNKISNLVFNAKANVVVTFLHEGAGYRNSFGFFTFNSAAEPASTTELETKILFPNTSYRGGGGYLYSGDSVALGEFDPSLGNDSIGFWVAADGWSQNRGFGSADNHFYSVDALNPEHDETDRKHMLLIAGDINEATNTQRLWVAVEDINFDSGHSDRDYNDLIMQIDVYPADALAFGNQIPDTSDEALAPPDADNDGVIASEDIDDNDPQRAFERYYPGENTWGTLLAEDNWPLLGDFDMNDMVVRYRTREVYDGAKQVKDITIEYRLEARGAAFHNGFAVSLGDQVFADNVELAELNGETVEPLTDSSYLSYEIFNDSWAYTYHGGEQCWTYNTMSDCPSHPSTDFKLDLTFANPVPQTQMLKAPYNPFLFAHKIGSNVNGYTRTNALTSDYYSENGVVKDIEIHLPYMPPTQGQDVSMFGTGDDWTDGVERFYVSENNLPWIIDVPDHIDYPEEFVDISVAYPEFSAWVQSGGTESKDWYRYKAEDAATIYQVVEDTGAATLPLANGIVVSDNFQDQQYVPFNLQVRNTTGSTVKWEALVENVSYETIPNLNLNGATLQTTDNGDGTWTHLFSGTTAAYQNKVMRGGVVEPYGNGSGLSLYAE
jgi:LruC domain-containing protein